MRTKHMLLVVLISFLFLFAGSVSSLAQQTARQEGFVLDEDGNPIKGAKVVFDRSGRASGVNHKELETDDSGRFVLTGVGGGTGQFAWTVTIQAPGYAPYSQRVDISSMGRNPDLSITLKKLANIPPAEGSVRSEAEDVINEGQSLIKEGKFDDAITLYNKFLEEHSETEELYKMHILIGEIYERKFDFKSAIERYRLVLDTNPDDISALLKIGNAHIRNKEIDTAEEYYKHLIELKGDDPTIMYTMAEMMMDGGKYDGAIQYYSKAIELNPEYTDAYMKLGYAYYGAKDWANAIKAFEKFLELGPDRPEAEFIKSDIEACNKKLAEGGE